MRRLFLLSALAATLFAQGLSTTTTTLPNAWAYVVYAPQTLAATGGQVPYTWAVSAGTLCTGLTLSTAGVLSGAPTVHGPCTFTVTVTDALNATANQAYTIMVNGPATTISGAVVISGKVTIR
ncbi:MAG: putative Ig domain-containing protein [Bryobacteraceae bacterium]|jgi:hypothetical protein